MNNNPLKYGSPTALTDSEALEAMPGESTEQIICKWISCLKNKKASRIGLIEVRRLINELSKESTGVVAYKPGFVRELSKDEIVRLIKLLINPGEVTLPSGERVRVKN